MCWVYILNNPETDRFYIGSTCDLEKRLKQHKAGNTRTTKILKAFDLVYAEYFESADLAREREKILKSYKSKKYIKWLIDSEGR